MAREFNRSEVSKVAPVSGKPPKPTRWAYCKPHAEAGSAASVERSMEALIAVNFLFAIGFGITDSVVRRTGNGAPAVTHNPIDIALFSWGALTGASWAAGLEPRNAVVQLSLVVFRPS